MVYPTRITKRFVSTTILLLFFTSSMPMQRKTPPPSPAEHAEQLLCPELGFTWVYKPDFNINAFTKPNVAGMGKPFTTEHITSMQVLCIGRVVSLSQEPIDKDLLGDCGIKILHLPMNREDAPRPEQIKAFLDFVRDPYNDPYNSSNIAIHCDQGNARVSTMLVLYLVAIEKLSLPDALQNVAKIREGKVQPNEAQLAMLRKVAECYGSAHQFFDK